MNPAQPSCSACIPGIWAVFVAEDQLSICSLRATLLAKFPAYQRVGAEESGPIHEGATLSPRLLLVDLEATDMRGAEVAQEIVERSPATRVVVLNDSTRRALLQATLASGIHGFLCKEKSLENLFAAMNALPLGQDFFDEEFSVFTQTSTTAGEIPGKIDTLTAHEKQLFRLITYGNSNEEVARVFGITVTTAEDQRCSLLRKLGACNAADLARAAFRLGSGVPQAVPTADRRVAGGHFAYN